MALTPIGQASPLTGRVLGLSPYGKPKTGELSPEQLQQIIAQNSGIAGQVRGAANGKVQGLDDRGVGGLVNKVVNEGYPLEEALKALGSGGYGQTIAQPTVKMSPYGKPTTGEVGADRYGQVLGQDPNATAQVTSLVQNRYGSVPDQRQLVGLVNKLVNEGYPIDQIKSLIGQDYELNNTTLSQAATNVGLEFDPKQSALERLMRTTQENLGRDVNAETQYGQLGDQKLASLYADLQKTLGQGASQTASLYGQAGQQVSQAYQGAAQALQGASAGVQGQLQEQMQKMGLQAAGSGVLPQLQQQFGDAQARNSVAGAGAQGNIQSLGAAISALANQGVSDSAREGVSERSKLANTVAGNIGDLQLGGMQDTRSSLEQLQELMGQRGQAMRQETTTLGQEQQDRTRQAQLDDLNKQLQLGGLDIERQQLGMSQQGQAFDQSMQQAQLSLEQAKLSASQATDPYEQILSQLKVQQAEANLKVTEAKLNGGAGKDIAYGKGREGVNRFIADKSTGYNLGPKFTGALNSILNTVTAGGILNPQEAAATAMNMALNGQYDGAGQIGPNEKEALLRAINIQYGLSK